jgi:hypothetical protein
MLDGFPLYYRQWPGLCTRLKFIAQAIDQIRRLKGLRPKSSSAIDPGLAGSAISGF